MSALAHPKVTLLPVSPDRRAQVEELTKRMLEQPQTEIRTQHLLHAGVYARTITLPAGNLLTSVLIKIPTVVVLNGDVTVSTNDQPLRFTGYNVLPGSASRKLAYLSHTDTQITMLFPSSASSVEEAEAEFTDETEQLGSRRRPDLDDITITGEHA